MNSNYLFLGRISFFMENLEIKCFLPNNYDDIVNYNMCVHVWNLIFEESFSCQIFHKKISFRQTKNYLLLEQN